ncbi:MAG: phage baseplate assembly protein V [Blastocatellia bacterium]
MSMSGALLDSLADREPAHKTYGVVVAMVTGVDDPEKLGRVKVSYPWLGENAEGTWARVAAPMAGNGMGIYFMPEVGDEVLVAFEHGDGRFPYVIGSLWNGKAKAPLNLGEGKNDVRMIKSRSGHLIRLTDEDGKEKIEIIDKSGKNHVTIDTATNTITIASDKDVTISAPKGAIKLDAQKIEIVSSADIKIEAGAGMDVKASAALNLKGAVVNIN